MLKSLFTSAAREEGCEGAARSFEYAGRVEKVHHALYRRAAECLAEGKDLPYTNMFVCRGCGNTVEGAPPDKCPVCSAPKSWFMWIE